MKTAILIIILAVNIKLHSQSVLNLGVGSSLGVLTGSDLCVSVINGPGILYGSGTLCGGLVSVEPVVNNGIPSVFNISQNYPNPFNPVTVIKYQIPVSANVNLKLYDQLGKEICVLFEGDQLPGNYQINIDGSDLSSGVYFCRFIAGEFSKVIKISLIK